MNPKKIISSLIFAFLTVSILPTTNVVENVQAEKIYNEKNTILDLSKSKSVDAKLDDVIVSVAPIKTTDNGLTTFDFTISDKKSEAVLSHIDWLITIKDPNNQKVFQSSTIHSHVGKNSFSYGFEKEGKHTLSVQVASLGPKMLGMDVPGPAQTRVVISGDPMNGWQKDPNKFFGAKNVIFNLDVPANDTVKFAENNNGLNLDSKTIDNSSILEGRNKEKTKVNVELLTNPQKVVAGQPTTVILNVKTENGTAITHPDILTKLSKEKTVLYQSAEQGNPEIAINGALHGHTGHIALDYTFPKAGMYTINTKVNSIPVSNVMFGSINPKYTIIVEEPIADTQEKIGQIGDSSTSNVVSIIGQQSPFYNPDKIQIKKGSSLKFFNNDAIPHTVTSTLDKLGSPIPSVSDSFDTGLLEFNESSKIKFDKEGNFNYFCTIHPFMQGKITVTT